MGYALLINYPVQIYVYGGEQAEKGDGRNAVNLTYAVAVGGTAQHIFELQTLVIVKQIVKK